MAEVLANYVKFLRGTPEAYAGCSKDPDTLYFVSIEGEKVGQLWIGDKLISMETTANGALNYLYELADVDTTGLADGNILTWSDAKQKWVVSTIDNAGSIPVEVDNTTLIFNSESKLSLKGFSEAAVNTQLIKDNDGNLSWVAVESSVGDLETVVNTLQQDVTNLDQKVSSLEELLDDKASIEYVNELITNINQLEYKVVTDYAELEQFVSENAETASKYIYLVPNGDIYDEYIYVENKIELLGSLSADVSAFETRISNLETIINNEETGFEALTTKVGTIEEEINTIKTSYVTSEQLTTIVGSLNDLVTDNKTNLVAAINELDTRTQWGTI